MKLRFRQVHLDFHTSEKIPGVGSKFSKENFQKMLKLGHVDSITLFSKCHHGWSYHPTKVNRMHPELKLDLLGAQIEAAHEIGVKTPVYISAGWDQKTSYLHPEWRQNSKNGTGDQTQPHWFFLCFNTAYLDELLAEIKEVCENYDADGIFMDICLERACYCPKCMSDMMARGIDPNDDKAVTEFAREVYSNFTRRVRETVASVNPTLPVFFNGSHITGGRRDVTFANTHLEVESLPTGGWGYDHFPLSAAYVRTLGLEFLGMTGKFHLSWGEFGGFKHKNALRYEAALNLASGAKCSIGDQMHPNGEMNETTYRLIGEAYSEVEKKEPWCIDSQNVSDIAVFTYESVTGTRIHRDVEKGVSRMLLEGHYLFDVVDLDSDISKYKVVILPDVIPINSSFKAKLEDFLAGGGKLLASGDSCVDFENSKMMFDFGCEFIGKSEFNPTYVTPKIPLENLDGGTYVIYGEANCVSVTDGEELAVREQPYFNRTIEHFCSHQHAPNSGASDGSGVTVGRHGAYIGWKLFFEYATKGSLINREVFAATLDRLIGDTKSVTTNLPKQGVTTLCYQAEKDRYIHHLLYAVPVKRGNGVEIIEDIIPVYNISATVRVTKKITKVYLAPEMTQIPFKQNENEVTYTVPEINNHAMVVLE